MESTIEPPIQSGSPPRLDGAASSRSPEDVRIFDLLAVLMRSWRLVVLASLAGGLVALASALLWPERYTVRTVLLPAQDVSDGRSQRFLSELPSGVAGMIGGNNSSQALVSIILESASLADSMVHRMEQETAIRAPAAEVREVLSEGTRIKAEAGGSVVIQVQGERPELITEVANTYPALLNTIMARLSAETAIRKQEFLEDQLADARRKLERSEERLVQFQITQEAPEVGEQARRTLEAAAQLQAQVMEQEIAVAQLRRTATPSNPQLRAAVAELETRRTQLRQLTGGSGGNRDVFLSLRETPDLQVAATRILRDFRKDEQVYTSLTSALAEAQVDAQNDLPVVNVLDFAELPTAPDPVPTRLLLGLGVLLGFMAGVFAAFARAYLRSTQADPANREFFAEWELAKAKTHLNRFSRRPKGAISVPPQ